MKKIVLVHGMNGTKESWNILQKELEKALDIKTEAIDLPGHDITTKPLQMLLSGTSGLYESGISMDDYVDEVSKAFADGKSNDTVLIGHSLGGSVISHVAARYSERIARLVYVAAMLPDHGQSARAIINEVRKNPPKMIKTFGDFAPYLKKLRFVRQPEEPLGAVFNRTSAFEALPKGYILCMGDDVIPKALQVTMIDAYKKSVEPPKVEPLNSGHLPQYEIPSELVEAIKKLLL